MGEVSVARFSNWLECISTGPVALATVIIFAAFVMLVLPRQAAAAGVATRGAASPDMSFTYSADDLYRMAEAYGIAGRAAYVRARFTFDLAWPVVYAAFLAASISWLNRGASASPVWLHRLNLLPILAAALDYLENCATSLVMLRYPQPTAVVDALAPAFTFFKWILLGAAFMGLVVAAGAAWRRRLLHRDTSGRTGGAR